MSSGEMEEKVEPEKVLKGVLNTLMLSGAAPKTNNNAAATSPVRRSATTSAFSTPSRSISTPSRSVSSSAYEENEFTEDFQLQYPSPLQPHLEMETNDVEEEDSLEEGEKTPSGEDAPIAEESPRSALDGIPFNATSSPDVYVPTAVTSWNGSSPTREETSPFGFGSLATIDSPQRALQSLLGSTSVFSSLQQPMAPKSENNPQISHPGMPPLPKGNSPQKSPGVEHSSPPQNAEPLGVAAALAAMQSAQFAVAYRTDEAETEKQVQPHTAPVNLSNASSAATQSQGSQGHHNDTTLLASNLRSYCQDMSSIQDMSQDASTFHNVTTFMSPDRSFAERSVSTPQLGDAKLATISDDQFSGHQNMEETPPQADQSYHSRQDLGQQLSVPTSDQHYQPHNPKQASTRLSPLPELPRHEQSQRQSPRMEGSNVPEQQQWSTRASPTMMPSAHSARERSQSSDLMYRPGPYEQARQGSPSVPSAHSTPERSFHSEPAQSLNQKMQPAKQIPPTPSNSSAVDRSYASEPTQRISPPADPNLDRSFQSEPQPDPYRPLRGPPLTPSAHSTPDRSYQSEPTRPSGQTVQHLRPNAGSSNQSTNSAPEPSSGTQPYPGSRTVASLNRMDRLTKAQNLVRRVRGSLLGESEAGMPPKPPSVPGAAPPAPLPQPAVSPRDKTPVVSNQNRKTFQLEEKKDTEDWSAAAVKQMSDAVVHIRHFGESLIYDGSPSRETESRVSEGSGQWWMKEQTFHSDKDDAKAEEVAKSLLEQSAPKTVGGSVASSQASPAPPPEISRTPGDLNLVKPVAVDLARTTDLILHPSVGKQTPAETNDDDRKTVLSAGLISMEPSTTSPGSRAMTPMMRMRVPGAQESVLMGDNEILPSPTEDSANIPAGESRAGDAASLSPRHNVEFALETKDKTAFTPDRSRRSKSSRSSKGRSRGSSTRRSRSSRSGRRRSRRDAPFGLAQCEGEIPFFLQSIIDSQCGQFLGEEFGSDSSYSSGESGDESDGDTYGDSFKSTPSRKKAPLLEMAKTTSTMQTEYTRERERPIDRERAREKERALARARETELASTEKELGARKKEQELTENERQRRERMEQQIEESDKQQRDPPAPAETEQAKEASRFQTSNQTIPDEERSMERVNRRRNDASNIRNKNFIREFIAELSKEGIKLLQHRRSHRQAFARPTEVTAYLHLGTEAGTNGFCEPCLQFLAHDGIPVVSVDLFDVRSLEKATALQLQSYPYAVPGNSLLIRTNPGDFVFEAKDEEDAVRIVHGMRWLIARLSFNLIIGNVNVSCELLDVGRKAFKQRVGDSNRAKAMNDLTNHLVDKSSLVSSP